MPDHCVFCQRIAAGEYGAHNAHAVSFEPLNPVTPGHLLVVSRYHATDAAQWPDITAETMRFAAVLADADYSNCNLITSIGPAATQTVFHLHIHIVPRYPGDGLTLPWTGQHRD